MHTQKTQKVSPYHAKLGAAAARELAADLISAADELDQLSSNSSGVRF